MNKIYNTDIEKHEGKAVVVKMVSGTELVVTVNNRLGEDKFCFGKAREVHAVPNEQGQMQLSIAKPWMVINPDAEFVVESKDVAAVYECPLDIEKFYLQQTSGIALA